MKSLQSFPSASSDTIASPSLAELATQALIDAVLSGEYVPGERLVEERLCERFAISRPPLREALKTLEHLGLVVQIPRRGAVVATLTHHDVYEIVTLRNDLEQMAMRLALPRLDPVRLDRCHQALAAMENVVPMGDEAAIIHAGLNFHIAVVSLAGHQRLEKTYRSMAMQLEMCMAMNNRARRGIEDLAGNVERHRRLLRIIETGRLEDVLDELTAHGHQSFLLDAADSLDGASAESAKWFEQLKATQLEAHSHKRATEKNPSH
jgi:DNA-binding GntR family transcriptional regulator